MSRTTVFDSPESGLVRSGDIAGGRVFKSVRAGEMKRGGEACRRYSALSDVECVGGGHGRGGTSGTSRIEFDVDFGSAFRKDQGAGRERVSRGGWGAGRVVSW